MTSILRQVVQHGTATAARKLDHPVAGKTGTTNDYTDAWFVGFSPSITCGVWVGFDEKKSLGARETGSAAALPIWINFMRVAIEGRDDEKFVEPATEPRAPVARVTVSAASHGNQETPATETEQWETSPPAAPDGSLDERTRLEPTHSVQRMSS